MLIMTLLSIFVIVGIIGVSLVLNLKTEKKKDEKKEDPVSYAFTYSDDYAPGSQYEVKVEDTSVYVKTTRFCSAKDCEPTIEEEKYTYSKENLQKLKDFIKELAAVNPNLNALNASSLSENQVDIIESIPLGEFFFELAVEKYEYRIEYDGSNTVSYNIYFKEDGTILVKKATINEDYDITNIEDYQLSFSDKNKKILKEYVQKEAESSDSKVILKSATLYKDEKAIIQSMVENKESYLEGIEETAKLAYVITYHGINCLTPVLRLYTDNTYELYDTYSETAVVPKTGNYSYDMKKLLANVNQYEESPIGTYTIQDSDNHSYSTSASNMEVNELLSSINVRLDKCITAS